MATARTNYRPTMDSAGQRWALRMFYFCCFGALGAFFPYLPPYLARRGLTPDRISWVMVLLPLASLAVPPLWGLAADVLRARARLLRLACAGAGITLLLMIPAASLAWILAAMGIHCLFRAPQIALGDAIAHQALGGRHERFARIRVWGSVGFAVCSAAMGALSASSSVQLLVGVPCAAYLFAAGATLGLPDVPGDLPRVHAEQALTHLRRPSTLLLLLATGVYYTGHATFDAFFSLHAGRLGYDDAFVGTAWAIGVGVEIGVMLWAPRVIHRSSTLLPICALTAAARWWALSRVSSAGALLALQPLHGITFGLWYLSLVKEIQDIAPPALRASLQGTAQAAIGVGMVAGYLGGGRLFASGGGALLYRVAASAAGLSSMIYFAARWKKIRDAAGT